MALSQRGDQRQSQGLVISQKMQQALKLLHLSNLELLQHLRESLESNPFLELPPESSDSDEGDFDAPSGADPRQDDVAFDDLSLSAPMRLRTLNDADDDDRANEQVAEAPSLREHLIRQLMIAAGDTPTRVIGVLLIDAVGDNGYLTETLGDISERINVSLAEVERVHRILLGFDPTGVAARTPAECLEMQLRERGQFTPAAEKLLQNLELLAKRDRRALMRVCGVSAEALETLIAQIRMLNPKPGNAYGHDPIRSVIPDLIVRQRGGVWQVELSDVGLPRLQVNRRYYQSLNKKVDSQAKVFLQENYRYADWLVKSLDRREKTIVRVADEIVRRQQGFFEQGPGHLQPLTLKSVAEALELHESTVSRVTAGKYLRCPRGIFELKFFFMSGVGGDEASASISSQTVKHHIKTLIDNESPDAVLSDDDLTAELARLGIRIARRTVSKYREAMKIPGARERRRQP